MGQGELGVIVVLCVAAEVADHVIEEVVTGEAIDVGDAYSLMINHLFHQY